LDIYKQKQEDSFTIKIPSVKKMKREVKKAQKKVLGQVDEMTKPISKKLGFNEQVRLNKDGSFVTIVPHVPPGHLPAFSPPSTHPKLYCRRAPEPPETKTPHPVLGLGRFYLGGVTDSDVDDA